MEIFIPGLSIKQGFLFLTSEVLSDVCRTAKKGCTHSSELRIEAQRFLRGRKSRQLVQLKARKLNVRDRHQSGGSRFVLQEHPLHSPDAPKTHTSSWNVTVSLRGWLSKQEQHKSKVSPALQTTFGGKGSSPSISAKAQGVCKRRVSSHCWHTGYHHPQNPEERSQSTSSCLITARPLKFPWSHLPSPPSEGECSRVNFKKTAYTTGETKSIQ